MPPGRCEDRAAVLGSVIEPYVEAAFFDLVEDLAATASVNGDEVEAAEAAAPRRRGRTDDEPGR